MTLKPLKSLVLSSLLCALPCYPATTATPRTAEQIIELEYKIKKLLQELEQIKDDSFRNKRYSQPHNQVPKGKFKFPVKPRTDQALAGDVDGGDEIVDETSTAYLYKIKPVKVTNLQTDYGAHEIPEKASNTFKDVDPTNILDLEGGASSSADSLLEPLHLENYMQLSPTKYMQFYGNISSSLRAFALESSSLYTAPLASLISTKTTPAADNLPELVINTAGDTKFGVNFAFLHEDSHILRATLEGDFGGFSKPETEVSSNRYDFSLRKAFVEWENYREKFGFMIGQNTTTWADTQFRPYGCGVYHGSVRQPEVRYFWTNSQGYKFNIALANSDVDGFISDSTKVKIGKLSNEQGRGAGNTFLPDLLFRVENRFISARAGVRAINLRNSIEVPKTPSRGSSVTITPVSTVLNTGQPVVIQNTSPTPTSTVTPQGVPTFGAGVGLGLRLPVNDKITFVGNANLCHAFNRYCLQGAFSSFYLDPNTSKVSKINLVDGYVGFQAQLSKQLQVEAVASRTSFYYPSDVGIPQTCNDSLNASYLTLAYTMPKRIAFSDKLKFFVTAGLVGRKLLNSQSNSSFYVEMGVSLNL